MLAIEELLPNLKHRHCLRYLYNNFKQKFKGLALKDKVWKTVTASNILTFSKHMEWIQNHFLFSVWAFRAIISSQFGRSEPPFLPSLAFKATISSQFWRLEHHHSQFWRSGPPSLLSLGFQSHHLFSVSVFRVIIILSFGVQNHHCFSVSAFRAIIILSFDVQNHHHSQFRRSEPSSLLNFGVQSHHIFSVWAFRATIPSQFGIQSHHLLSV